VVVPVLEPLTAVPLAVDVAVFVPPVDVVVPDGVAVVCGLPCALVVVVVVVVVEGP